MSDLRKSLTPREAAEKFGYTAAHIRRLICAGELEAEKIGTNWLVDPDSIRKYWHRKGRGRTGTDRLKAMKEQM